jgi:SnoaL-like protein
MNATLETQVNWLVDRARISDLLFSFAAALDTKNWRAYCDNYAESGYIELPDPTSSTGGTFVLRKDQMMESVPKSLGRYHATHHISTNHQITIEGDKARSRSYLQAVHIAERPTEHWTAGGWYDAEYQRQQDGWKFTRVKLTSVWLDGAIKPIRPSD